MKRHLFRLKNGYLINRIAKNEYVVIDKHNRYICVNDRIKRWTLKELQGLARI